MADRYTYLPLVGIFVIAAWGIPDLLDGWRFRRYALGAAGGVVVLAFAACSWFQAAHWRSGAALFTHAIEVTADNWLAQFNLGVALERDGRIGEAAARYAEAIRIYPAFPEAHFNLGLILFKAGLPAQAHPHFREVVRQAPRDREAVAYLRMTQPPGEAGR